MGISEGQELVGSRTNSPSERDKKSKKRRKKTKAE